MTFKHTHITADGGVAPPPPPPPPPSACSDCGSCSFSDGSSLAVTKLIFQCVDVDPPNMVFQLVSHTEEEEWPWVSASASEVKWQLDANNFATYDCALNKWNVSFDTSDPGDYVGGPCAVSTSPAGYITPLGTSPNPCSGFEFHRVVNGADAVLLRAVVMNNICIPSTPALRPGP